MTTPTAVIDLGTNTFHLLIATCNSDEILTEVYRERVFVKLASNGIETIGAKPYQTAVYTMLSYKDTLDQYGITTIRAIGTAALRTATNGPDFVKEVFDKTNIKIELISGEEEARLIHKGVTHAVPFNEENMLIMDIGGGSVEFIIANQDGIKWAQSFPIGVAVLFQKFHHTDPITATEIQTMYSALTNLLSPLFQQLTNYPITALIGASGTFDIVEDFLAEDEKFPLYARIPIHKFHPFSQQLVQMTLAQRLEMEKLPDSRADLIVVALLLIEFIIEKSNINTIYTSAYAMKEGVLLDS